MITLKSYLPVCSLVVFMLLSFNRFPCNKIFFHFIYLLKKVGYPCKAQPKEINLQLTNKIPTGTLMNFDEQDRLTNNLGKF